MTADGCSPDELANTLAAWAAGDLPDAGQEALEDSDGAEDDDPFVLKDRGRHHFQAGRYGEACDCYSDAIDAALAGDFVEGQEFASVLYCNRAACQLSLGDNDAALLDAGRAVKLNKANAKAFFRKGQALMGLKRFDDALECLGRAHQLAPGDASCAKLLAECAPHVRSAP